MAVESGYWGRDSQAIADYLMVPTAYEAENPFPRIADWFRMRWGVVMGRFEDPTDRLVKMADPRVSVESALGRPIKVVGGRRVGHYTRVRRSPKAV